MLIFLFTFINQGGGSKKDLAAVYVKECSVHVFLQSFIVSSITFRFLTHFYFILCMVLESDIISIFSHSYLFFLASLIEETALFSIVYSCLLCHNFGDSRHVDLSLGFCPGQIVCISLSFSVPVPHCLNYCSFTAYSEVRSLILQAPFFLLKITLAIWGLLCFHMNCNFFF